MKYYTIEAGAESLKIKSCVVEAKASSESIFAGISKRINEPLVLYVDRDDKSRLYMVALYLPTSRITPIYSLLKSTTSREKSKIVTYREYSSPTGYFAIMLKDSCEFFQLLSSYNVKLVIPYTIFRGVRRFCVYGLQEEVDKYIDNLVAYYGPKNLSVRRVDTPKCFELSVLNVSRSILLSGFTQREVEVLWKAFSTGYLFQPKRSGGLDAISKSVGLSKPATSIMLRKAMKKLFKKLFEDAM